VLLYLAAGALLVAGSLILHAGRVMDISRQVGGGISGLPILVLGVLCAPNAAVAGSAYLLGPGFAVGASTKVGMFSTSHGLLPAFPILGGLPQGRGANELTLAFAAAVLLITGIATAIVIERAGLRGRERAAAAFGAAGGFALVMLILAWRAGGAIGRDSLSVVGASPWRVGLVSFVLLAGSNIAVLLAHWIGQRLVPVFIAVQHAADRAGSSPRRRVIATDWPDSEPVGETAIERGAQTDVETDVESESVAPLVEPAPPSELAETA